METEKKADFYERYDDLLTFAQMEWRSIRVTANLSDAFAFVRWVLRAGASVLYYIIGLEFAVVVALPFMEALPGDSLFCSPEVCPHWVDKTIKSVIAILISIGLAGGVRRGLELTYNTLVSHLIVVSGSTWKQAWVWLVTVGLGIVGFSTVHSLLITGSDWFLILKLMAAVALYLSLGSGLIAISVLFAFPGLRWSVPLSLGYWRATEAHDREVVSETADYLREHFRPSEITVCESLIRTRLGRFNYTGSGLEIAVGLLGIMVALIAFFPVMDWGILLDEQDVTDVVLAGLLALFVLVWVWQMLSLRGLRGEGFHVLSLAAEACVLTKQEATSQPDENCDGAGDRA